MVDKKILDMLEKLPKEYLYSINNEIVEQWKKYQYDCYRQNIADELVEALPFLAEDCYNKPYTCARYKTFDDAKEGECLDFITPRSINLLDCFVDIYEWLGDNHKIIGSNKPDDPNDENWRMIVLLEDGTFLEILPY